MNMKKFFYRLTPKYFAGQHISGDRWSSFRWFGNGWDSQIYNDGTRFIQFGKNPIKFISVAPKGAEVKKFLLGSRWKTYFYRKGIRAGITTKAKDFTKLWRLIDGNRNRTGLRAERKPSRLLQLLR